MDSLGSRLVVMVSKYSANYELGKTWLLRRTQIHLANCLNYQFEGTAYEKELAGGRRAQTCKCDNLAGINVAAWNFLQMPKPLSMWQ